LRASLRFRELARDYAFALPALALFCVCALSHIRTPGMYMDAVNPDYLVLHDFGPKMKIPVWVLPGQLLFGFFPILIQIYHGALPFYFGFPIYLLFGTDIIGVRIANLEFGLLVLAGAAFALRAFRIRPLIAGVALAALAIDPGFILDFRTQFYITTLPLALVFFAIGCVEREGSELTARTARLAGILAGLSVYGYFIFFFLLPAAGAHVWRSVGPGATRKDRLRNWGFGLAIGLSPYALGFVLIVFGVGGPGRFAQWLLDMLGALHIDRSAMTISERFAYAWNLIFLTTRAVGPAAMLIGALHIHAAALKTALLLGVPGLAFLINCFIRRRSEAVLFAGISLLGLAAMFVIFGNRMWLHHAAPVLPLLWFALAAALNQVLGRWNAGLGAALAALPIAFLAYGNALDRQHAMIALEQTGGLRLSSDAILRFADDALHDTHPTLAFFPDWGVYMPFAMETQGAIPMSTSFDPAEARAKLCAGQDVLLAVVAGIAPERIPVWIDSIGWTKPETRAYNQRDDVPVMTSLRWRASDPPLKPCGG
jgi:hypothetical protein